MKRKTILITGASSGFGLLTAIEMLKRDHNVIAGLRGGLERFQGLLPEDLKASGNYDAIDLHMEQPETFKRAQDLVTVKHSGKLDVLINNAGFGLMGPVEMAKDEELRYQMEVNFFGPSTLIQSLLPALRQSESGRVINISSIAGLMSLPFYGAYCASKFALNGWTEALYYELRPQGVQVALVEPGGFKTDFVERSLKIGTRPAGGIYDTDLQNFKRTLREKSKDINADPIKVVRKLISLTERSKMPLHNIVGTDARAMWSLSRLLPLSWTKGMTSWLFQKIMVRGPSKSAKISSTNRRKTV